MKERNPENQINKRIAEGRERGASYLVVIFDSFEMEEINAFAMNEEHLNKIVDNFNQHATTHVSEIIKL